MLDKIVLITLSAFTLGSLGQIFRISGVNLYLYDLVVIGANLVLLLFFIKKKKFYINSPLIFFMFFSLFSFTVTFFQTKDFLLNDKLYVLSFWVRFNAYFIFSYLVFLLLKFKFIASESIKKILIQNFYFLTFLNIVQYIFLRDISFMEQFGFDPHTQRLTGFFLDPNFMGFYLILYLFLNEIYLKNKYISYISLFMIFLTESRTALVLLIVFLLSYLVKDLKKSLILGVLCLILFSPSNFVNRIEHLSAPNDSSTLRIESWNKALEIYSMSPIFGIGFNNYKNYLISLNVTSPDSFYTNSINYSDSSLLSILTFGGILGLLLFTIFLASFVINYQNLVFITLVLIGSFIINGLFFPPLAILIFLILNLNLLEKI